MTTARIIVGPGHAHPVLRPIRVLPIPPNQPPPMTPGRRPPPREHDPIAVQEALALELRPRRLPEPPATDALLPDPVAWGRGAAQLLVEVMAGLRAPAQVVRMTSADVFVAVARRHAGARRREAAGLARGGPQRPPRRLAVRTVRACEPARGVAELSVVLIDGNRVRAMAMRLVDNRGSWVVEALQVA